MTITKILLILILLGHIGDRLRWMHKELPHLKGDNK